MTDELWPVAGPDAERRDVAREILLSATCEEVWDALASERGRERWLERESEREVEVELEEEPRRLVWWWRPEHGCAPTRVEFLVSAVAGGTRVLVIESSPHFPLRMFASAMALVAA